MKSIPTLKFIIAVIFAIVFCATSFASHQLNSKNPGTAQASKSSQTLAGDKAFATLKFSKALRNYTRAMKIDADSIYLMQKIAECYKALHDRPNAEIWYAKLADNPSAPAINKYYYAELLRMDAKYLPAQKYYEQYALTSDSKVLQSEIDWMDSISLLVSERGGYKIEPLGLNTAQSEYAPTFYREGVILFTQSRGQKNLYDCWAMCRNNRLYTATLGKDMKVEPIKLNLGPHSFTTSSTFYPPNSELIFGGGTFDKKGSIIQKGKLLPLLKLYSAVFVDGKASSILPLTINGDNFSNTTPSISSDGKTLYFASDRLGGLGGTDIYMSTLNANGTWSEPTNLGAAVNTPFDEKFPFITEDGTLYFSSNSPNGLGGLDIYKTRYQDGVWSKPENLGKPINSSSDDFGFIMNANNNGGYFTSNRPGGMGEADIYKFTYDENQSNYKITVSVIDANSLQPLVATLTLDCDTAGPETSTTGTNGIREYQLKEGRTCLVEGWAPGYIKKSTELSPENKNTTVTMALTPLMPRLIVFAKEVESGRPIRNISFSIKSVADSIPMNYITNDSGSFEASLSQGDYIITSGDYPSIKEIFSTKEADAKTGIATRLIEIRRDRIIIKVTLTANCFASTVTVTELKTGGTGGSAPQF